MQVREKVEKSRIAKAAAAEPSGEMRVRWKKMPLWREAHFEVKMPKAPHWRTTLGSCDVEKVKAVVTRSPLRREAHLEVKMYKAHMFTRDVRR